LGQISRNMVKYAMDGTFAAKKLLQHPTFGLGLVCRVMPPNKIEVLFRDGARRLRTAGARCGP